MVPRTVEFAQEFEKPVRQLEHMDSKKLQEGIEAGKVDGVLAAHTEGMAGTIAVDNGA